MTLLGTQLSGRLALGERAPARWLHPGAWWLWALGLATAATRSTNPVVLMALVAAAGAVVYARRPDAPWARSFRFFLILGAVVIGIRVLTQIIFGTGASGAVLFTLPTIGLPDFFAGVTIGGPVYTGDILYGLQDGLRLATLLICIGAASSLASPSRMLKVAPAAVYELGVAVVVALTFAPQLVSDIVRVRSAQRLRGRSTSGLHGWWAALLVVVNGGLERSVQLAAAMDSRGYGRTAHVPPLVRRTTAAVLLIGVGGLLLGLYGTLSGGSAASLGPPLIAAGAVISAIGLMLSGRRQVRTHYRPDPWALPEWLVILCGAAPAVVFIAAGDASFSRIGAGLVGTPALTLPVVAACAIAALPALVAPPVPEAVRR